MNILITGVNGLLGFELANLLCADSANTVYGLSRSAKRVEAGNYNHLQLNLDTSDFIPQLPGSLDAIIHLAQSEKFRDFPSSANEVFSINTLSTLKLLDFGRSINLKTFIYASSGGVYGNRDVGFTEDSPVMGNGDLGFYLSTKLCSEILADNYSDFFNVVQLRFFFMYGELQHKNMLIPRLVQSVIHGRPITVMGKEGITINPVYVADAALAVQKALTLGHSDKINVGGSEQLSIRQIANIISAKVGIDPVIDYIDGEPKNLIGDITKMKQELCGPTTAFETGIDRLIAGERSSMPKGN